MKEDVTKVIDMITQKGLPWGLSEVVGTATTSALQPEEITSKGTRVSCVYYHMSVHTKKVWKLI